MLINNCKSINWIIWVEIYLKQNSCVQTVSMKKVDIVNYESAIFYKIGRPILAVIAINIGKIKSDLYIFVTRR